MWQGRSAGALSATVSMCMDVSDGRWKISKVHFVLHCGSYAAIRAKYSSSFQSAHCHGEDDAQVLQYLFKQDNQLESGRTQENTECSLALHGSWIMVHLNFGFM